VTTSCVPSAVTAAALTSVLAVSWAHPGFSEQQATSQTTPANSQGETPGACGAGSVLHFVCCVFGVIPNAKTQRFGIWGVASAICNNVIADLAAVFA
jgi:hypothetical protein